MNTMKKVKAQRKFHHRVVWFVERLIAAVVLLAIMCLGGWAA